MYVPPAFREDDPSTLRQIMREARLSTLVTATPEGLVATPLPLILDESEGEHGVLYGHLAKANPQWKLPVTGEALAIFSGPDAYVTPSWYAAKQEHGKVVPSLRNHSHLNLVLFGQRLMLDVCVDPAINNLHLRISQFPRD